MGRHGRKQCLVRCCWWRSGQLLYFIFDIFDVFPDPVAEVDLGEDFLDRIEERKAQHVSSHERLLEKNCWPW